mgnify:CR=1 FL=1
MKTVVIVQARMGSTRLPGKALRSIAGVNMTERVIQRVRQAGYPLLLAVPDRDRGMIGNFVTPSEICGGSEKDVLARYYDAARFYDVGAVVRVTGDCPLVDPGVIEECRREFTSPGGWDYFSTSHPCRTLPSGFDVEVFSFDALRHAHFTCENPVHREHVTQHFYQCPSALDGSRAACRGRYRLGTYQPHPTDATPEMLKVKLSVDTEEDLARVEAVIQRAGENRSWREYTAAAMELSA